MCSIFLPLFFLSQLITGTEIEFRGHVRFSLAFRSDALAVNTNGSSGESYGARWPIRASNEGVSIAPSLTRVFEHSVKACKSSDQWKIARVSAAFKKGREEDRTCYGPLSMLSIHTKTVN